MKGGSHVSLEAFGDFVAVVVVGNLITFLVVAIFVRLFDE